MTWIYNEDDETIRSIIRSSLERSKNPCVFFSGGKNSLVLLHFLRECGNNDLPVIHIDSGSEFPEVRAYVQKMKKLWKLNLIVEEPDKQVKETDKNPGFSCGQLKMEMVVNIVVQQHFDCVFFGDTCETQDSLSKAILNHPEYSSIIIKPLAHLTSEEIRDHVRKFNLPCCSLYRTGNEKIDYATSSCMPEKSLKQNDEEIIRMKLKKLGYF